jgi:hypothetical protein
MNKNFLTALGLPDYSIDDYHFYINLVKFHKKSLLSVLSLMDSQLLHEFIVSILEYSHIG